MSRFATLPFRVFRERLESFGLIECEPRVDETRVFTRVVMGLGAAFQAVPYRGEDGLVYPEEIERVTYVLGVPQDQWLKLDEH